MSASPDISVIICTLNEAGAISGVISELVSQLGNEAYEIIVVDDSPDERTGDVVRALATTDSRIQLVRRPGGSGLASAAITGWDTARGRLLAIMDGDGQHDPAIMKGLLGLIREKQTDLAASSRYIGEEGTGLEGSRDLISKAGTALSQFVLPAALTDPLAGMFVMTREWYEHVRPRLSGVGFKILVDIAASGRRKPSVAELPTALRVRKAGSSKLDWRVMLDLGGLLVEKQTRGLIPARFVSFAIVGATGVLVHVAAQAFIEFLGADFLRGYYAAALFAMTWNFLLNNVLTFKDNQLKGHAFWRGLFAFYGICVIGALIGGAAGSAALTVGLPWLVATVTGVLIGGIWNFAISRQFAWNVKRQPVSVSRPEPPPAGQGGA